jgi:predicted RNA-binding protein with PIN domain
VARKDRVAEAEARAGLGGPDVVRVSGALERALEASEQTARALADVTAELVARRPAAPPDDGPPPSRRSTWPRRRRTAVRLPPPLVDNTPEAVLHLVRQPGMTVLVDGYNISMAAWPGTKLAHQRERLIDALDSLHARYGADVIVVFDGDTGGRRPPTGQARTVKALFTEAGEIADDRIVAMVSSLPGTGPVLVVTSDRELKDRVRSAGANVVSARPFLAVLLR